MDLGEVQPGWDLEQHVHNIRVITPRGGPAEGKIPAEFPRQSRPDPPQPAPVRPVKSSR